MSGIQGIHWVSLDTSIQGDIGKQPNVAITAQQGQGNKGLRSIKDEDIGTPQSSDLEELKCWARQGNLAWAQKKLDNEYQF